MNLYEIIYKNIKEEKMLEDIVKKVFVQCFKEEKIQNSKLYISVMFTDNENIQKINKKYRNIDQSTDVLSFPMYTKEELDETIKEQNFSNEEILGDIVISIPRVEEQAKEYGHSFERELSYMLVHGFYHLRGYDHINEDDKKDMREKEEKVLEILQISR